MYKQIIILRKDLNMSLGKACAQVSHASMAFLTSLVRDKKYIMPITKGSLRPWGSDWEEGDDEVVSYDFEYCFDKGLYEEWLNNSFTKVVLQARNKNQLLKAKQMAEDLGMKEGEDFFCIYDACRTELDPEEENGTTLTCIGFKPMESERIDQIGKKYHMYV